MLKAGVWYHIAKVQEAAVPLFLPCCNFARLEFAITLGSFFLLAQKKSKLFFHIFVSVDLDKFNLEKPLPCLYFYVPLLSLMWQLEGRRHTWNWWEIEAPFTALFDPFTQVFIHHTIEYQQCTRYLNIYWTIR